ELLSSPELSNYIHFLKFNRDIKPHQLTEQEEQIILMKNLTGVSGFKKLYNELTSSFTYEFEIDGEVKTLTGSEILDYMYHGDKDIRYRALRTYLSEYEKNELIFTHIYNNVLKDWVLESKKKNYKKPITRRNLQNEVSDETVKILGEVTTKSNTIVERYYKIKKRILNLPELRMSDMYAPLGDVSKKYTYGEGVEILKIACERFSTDFNDIIEKMVVKGHVDVTPRKGKVGGAYCAFGKMRQLPFVFVNFTENVESVLTLAHEFGHAFHAYYSQQTQSFINIDTSLAVAEIASLFAEILTFEYMMSLDLSKEDKILLLANQIEGNFATSHRQNAFYRFEKQIHELLEKDLPSAEQYKNVFSSEMKLMFGNSITNIEEDYASYIFSIPHFLQTPFYVYAYNMSNLLVIAIYQLYREQKEEFIPKYIKLLSIGSSLSPEEMLKELEIDLNDPSFWQKGVDYLSRKIDDLENLLS
ncbi:MAG: M3 family metallopeptidase, partial [Candidatus Heimdallarchaeota archaeon]